MAHTPSRPTSYPASIRVKEPPPNPIVSDSVHAPAPIQENGQHAFPQIYNLLVLFRVGGVRGVISHAVLLGNRRDDQGGMKSGKSISQRGKLGVPPTDFEILGVWRQQQENVDGGGLKAQHTPVRIV